MYTYIGKMAKQTCENINNWRTWVKGMWEFLIVFLQLFHKFKITLK